MSRAGYTECWGEEWSLIRWRGQVASTIRGKNGQTFLREMLTALDALPEKRLIAEALQEGDQVCAIGSVGVQRAVDLTTIDPEDYNKIAEMFGITHQLVREIEWINDEAVCVVETPEQRWIRVREWVVSQIRSA